MKITLSFSSADSPFLVTVTLTKLNDQGHLRSSVSLRSESPQTFDSFLEVQSIWEDWLSLLTSGSSPDLPQGWRVFVGDLKAATLRPPNRFIERQ